VSDLKFGENLPSPTAKVPQPLKRPMILLQLRRGWKAAPFQNRGRIRVFRQTVQFQNCHDFFGGGGGWEVPGVLMRLRSS